MTQLTFPFFRYCSARAAQAMLPSYFIMVLLMTLSVPPVLAQGTEPLIPEPGSSSPGAGPGEDGAPVWQPETFTLANGMEVVVLPDHRAPVVTHMVWYRVGAADEQPMKSGIAHFLEHLMFKGTSKIPPGEFSKIVARNGGQDNAFTSQDYTAYFQRVALDRLPLLMEMEADRMRGLILSDEVVLPERDVILEERSSRTDNNPENILSEQVTAALYMAHPYGIPVIGWEHEIKQLTRVDALAFYKQYYAPNNAILIVAGDITAEKLLPLAEKFYGTIPAGDIKPRLRVKEPPAVASRRIDYKDERVKQASFQRSYLAPSYSTAQGPSAHALDILSQVLGAGSTSRLYRALVVEGGLAASAGAYYSGSSLDYGRLVVYALPRAGVSLEQIEEAVDEVIAAFIKEGVSEEEMQRAKFNAVADATYARDSQRAMANAFGVALTTGQSVADVMEYPEHIKQVTFDDVSAAARLVFESKAYVSAYLKPDVQ